MHAWACDSNACCSSVCIATSVTYQEANITLASNSGPSTALAPVTVIPLTVTVASMGSAGLQELRTDLHSVMRLAKRSAEYQLAVYMGAGSQYVKHRDALPDDGADPNQRRVSWTCCACFVIAFGIAVVKCACISVAFLHQQRILLETQCNGQGC